MIRGVEVIGDGGVLHVVPLTGRPMTIGRAPDNDLVLTEPSVSWHHASVWTDGVDVWLRDHGSSNGTCGPTRQLSVVNDEVDAIRLGSEVTVRVKRVRGLMLDDLTAGVRLPLVSDRFHIGSSDDADLRLPDGPPRAATLLIHTDAEV